MKTHEISILQPPGQPYLRWLATGQKTAEGRVNKPVYRAMHPGDGLHLIDRQHGESLQGVITFLHAYPSFEAMLRAEGVRNMLPFLDDDALAPAIAIYEAFPGAAAVATYGCVAIGFRSRSS